jgi:hypothetical protein
LLLPKVVNLVLQAVVQVLSVIRHLLVEAETSGKSDSAAKQSSAKHGLPPNNDAFREREIKGFNFSLMAGNGTGPASDERSAEAIGATDSPLSAVNACSPHAHVGVADEEGACIAAGEVACAAAYAPVSADTGGIGLSAAGMVAGPSLCKDSGGAAVIGCEAAGGNCGAAGHRKRGASGGVACETAHGAAGAFMQKAALGCEQAAVSFRALGEHNPCDANALDVVAIQHVSEASGTSAQGDLSLVLFPKACQNRFPLPSLS